jgi:resuscitation-promoting factor RpfB
MHRLFLSRSLPALFVLFSLLTGCRSPQVASENITVSISADGASHDVTVPAGSTVSQAIQVSGTTTENQDIVEPPPYTVLSSGDVISITRVQDILETEQSVIPFESQVVRNETLPEGEKRLVQEGSPGLKEITYRRRLENGVEVNKVAISSVVLQEAVPEIMMVGAQSSFAPLPIPGKIAYLADGNAWIIDTSTANRTALLKSDDLKGGGLDGRIFKLSPNGNYLLFTRHSTKSADQEINTLWAVRVADKKLINIGASNVVHFAGWLPNSNSIMYSTVEPRSAAPGWQANNDLYRYSITTGERRKVLDASSGGVYGWWGSTFAFSPDGKLAYAYPDGIGLVDIDGKYTKPLLDIVPLNTHSDWAWLPSLAWGADGNTLYFTSHAPPPSLVSEEDSPYFDISATSMAANATVQLVEQTGMFSYPASSALHHGIREKEYQIAYLQAIFPEQSKTSRYRLWVMDKDGSNRRMIFPANDAPGLEPQTPVWAPESINGQSGDFIAVVYQDNLWLVDSGNSQAYQITGDGRVDKIDWE